jgi:myo-inositol-1(or 4)-monophosphatase
MRIPIHELIMLLDEEELLQIATAAAEAAGKKILQLFRRSKLSVRRKYDYPGSIVTNADKESEKTILERIRQSKLRCTVYSEEAGKISLGSSDIVWAVDPLDGTLNYVKRIPHFAVSIGVLIKRKPIGGVIYNPNLDEMFTANRDHGAYLNGKRIHVSGRRPLRGSSIIFEWWDREPSIPDPLKLEGRLYRFTRSVRSPGSVALNLCSVASGRFDGLVTVFRRSPIYETAAGCMLIQEAAGRVTNSSGEGWEDFSGSILAGGPQIHRQLLSLVRAK